MVCEVQGGEGDGRPSEGGDQNGEVETRRCLQGVRVEDVVLHQDEVRAQEVDKK